ncbi:hypothetical protein PENSUB_13391 [Penicillium subrubescens]|uniref:Uncharacterized protein n=1 Tax=Penicillium subrubescens TaxID=1316194 RepID=A0A1Q5SRQ2_9EURO|nr:hypothetical protein PENSUB_13391 [Penicillium subrubescens]
MANDPSSRARLRLDPTGEPPSTPPGQIRRIPSPSASESPPNVYPSGPAASHQYTTFMDGDNT